MQIAYDQLPPVTRQYISALNHRLDRMYPPQNLIKSATWADRLVIRGVHNFDHWHYINSPYSQDGIGTRVVYSDNVVWAIEQSRRTLKSPQANEAERALFLRFLLHFVGDVHQPLHAFEYYDEHYPDGTQGGNLYPIKSKYGNNLHRYWDHAGGWTSQQAAQWPLSSKEVKRLAKLIEARYPKSHFARELQQLEPKSWAEESFMVARKHAYTLAKFAGPGADYEKNAQAQSTERMALAGYRLAQELIAIEQGGKS